MGKGFGAHEECCGVLARHITQWTRVVRPVRLGLIAARSIKKGQRVLSEAPIVSLRQEDCAWRDEFQKLRSSGHVPRHFEDLLRKELDGSKLAGTFWELCDCFTQGTKTASGIWSSTLSVISGWARSLRSPIALPSTAQPRGSVHLDQRGASNAAVHVAARAASSAL